MILSHRQIEEIAVAVTKDFNEFFFGPDTEEARLPRGTPIDQFARDYLGLDVSFAPLSPDGSICGLTSYALRELKTREDWNEWQANVLGAAILMPQREIDLAVAYYARGRKLISYDGTFAYWDKVALDRICQQFGVSKTAAVIRLKQLGHLETRPYSEYSDPLEVWA